MLKKIVSGVQTGVDRAAFDVARVVGVEHGGLLSEGGNQPVLDRSS
jgi:hypothetical protein